MKIVELVAEGEKVAGRFTCSGTNLGEWRGKPPTGHRFEDVDEVYFFRVVDGLIVEAWGLEDTIDRLRQLRQDNEQDQEASPGVRPTPSWPPHAPLLPPRGQPLRACRCRRRRDGGVH